MKDNGQISIMFNTTRTKGKTRKETRRDDQPDTVQHAILREMEEEMTTLVGMQNIKETLKEIYAWIYMNKRRAAAGLKTSPQVLHMMFKGNPGTGKTTVARLVGKLFKKMGVLPKGHLIEAERADLVGEYIGHTAQKTRDLIKKADGGILFVDEAYSLGRGGEKDFGKEAIDTLVKHMEDKQHTFILILAGYSYEMDNFLKLNPGLHSRFPLVFQFPDYNVNELMEIASRMLGDRQYELSMDAKNRLREHLIYAKTAQQSTFSNGRYVRNIIEKAVRTQAVRLLHHRHPQREDLLTLQSRDFIFKE